MTAENPAPWIAEGKQRQQRRQRQRELLAEARQAGAQDTDDTPAPATGDFIRDALAQQTDDGRHSLRRVFGDQYDTNPDTDPPAAA
ncbi:hypothetical protein [Streptomyces microflavus]|uniref:hypothetical protein n=1 Tax=Streptomyces microflavus TaxID=1919 RepID=UPI00324F5B6E